MTDLINHATCRLCGKTNIDPRDITAHYLSDECRIVCAVCGQLVHPTKHVLSIHKAVCSPPTPPQPNVVVDCKCARDECLARKVDELQRRIKVLECEIVLIRDTFISNP